MRARVFSKRHSRPDRAAPNRGRPWRKVAFVLGGVMALLVVVGGLTAFRLASVSRNLSRARTLIDSAGNDLEAGRLASAQRSLADARVKLVSANSDLYTSAELDLVAWVPVLHENLMALRDSVGVSLKLVNGGQRILTVSQSLQDRQGKLQVPLRDGAIPLDVVSASATESDALSITLPTNAERYHSSMVLPELRHLQDRVYAEADRRRVQLRSVARALSLIVEMSGGNGPRRYMIAVSNTAEERGAGGMILSYGELESSAGDFRLSRFGRIGNISLDRSAKSSLPADYKARWGGFQPSRIWRNANLGADFTVVAPTMESMYQEATKRAVDGVIQVDPAGLAAILRGTGPVTVKGVGEVTADNVVPLSLNLAYTRFPDRDNRQELLGDVAKAVFRRLLSGRYSSLRPLGEALSDAVAQRHLLMHSDHLGAQRQLEYFDADGALPPADSIDWMHLTVQNISANKLDYYLDTSVSVTGRRRGGEAGRVVATVAIANNAPVRGAPRYVFGPNLPDQEAGRYRGIVSLYLPTGTALIRSRGRGAFGRATTKPAFDTEAGASLVAFQVDLAAGARQKVRLELTLPPRPVGDYRLTLVPQPRVQPTSYSIDLSLGDGSQLRRRVVPSESLALVPNHRPVVVSGPGSIGRR